MENRFFVVKNIFINLEAKNEVLVYSQSIQIKSAEFKQSFPRKETSKIFNLCGF